MTIKEIWPAFGAPAIAVIFGVYHKYVVNPRVTKVESKVDGFTADIAELKTDIKWIRSTLNKQFNGKGRG